MTRKRNPWLTALLIIVLLCGILLASTPGLLTSFPEIFFGQVYLSRDFKPPSARELLSAEFLLHQVADSEIESAEYILLREDVLFWDPYYVGFPRAALTNEEISLLQGTLSAGTLFQQADGGAFECLNVAPGREPQVEPCPDGSALLDRFVDLRWEAELNRSVGVLQFSLSGGRMAEIRVYPSGSGLSYEPYELAGEWWLDGVASASAVLDVLAARAGLAQVPVMWPELNEDQANARAGRIIGEQYHFALETVRKATAIGEVFGEIQEVRPAAAANEYSSWMDASGVTLTFRVTGTRGEGAVLARGQDCFDLRMVFLGVPRDDGGEYICP